MAADRWRGEEYHPSDCINQRHHRCRLRVGNPQAHHHVQHRHQQLHHVRLHHPRSSPKDSPAFHRLSGFDAFVYLDCECLILMGLRL